MNTLNDIPFSEPAFFVPVGEVCEEFDAETLQQWEYIDDALESDDLVFFVADWVWAAPPPVVRANTVFDRVLKDVDLQRSATRGWRDKEARKVISIDEALARFEETP